MAQLPAPINATQTTPLVCDSAQPLTITFDLTALPVVKATAVSLPYNSTTGAKAQLSAAITNVIANAVAAVAQIPSFGPLLAAINQAETDYAAYYKLRLADVATAQAKADTAKAAADAAVTAAQAAEATALTARSAAFTTRTGPTDPAWLAADTAWKNAQAATAAAKAPADPLQAAAVAAQNVVKAATAALDPSLPPVQV